MLTGPKLKLVEDLVGILSREELVWTEGYLAGLLAGKTKPSSETVVPVEAAPVAASIPAGKISIVYGTETGNAKKLATEFAAKAKKRSLVVKLTSLDQYRLTDITKEENLFVVISTQGDGEPPAAAQKFYDHIHRNGFRLDNLKYSVLALGDTAYPMFCKTGEDVDSQLRKLGGTPIIPIRKCDLDYENDAEQWFNEVLQTVTVKGSPEKAVVVKPAAAITQKSNKKLYTATVLSTVNLHDRGATKETYHIELTTNEEVDYLPGDSIGVVPKNPQLIVNTIIELTGISRDRQLTHKDASYSVFDLLKQKLSISYLHERVVKKYAEIVQQAIPETKMDLLDLLRIYPVKDAAQFETVIQALPAQSPRIYTIASSNAAHSGEVHLTVEKELFAVNGQTKTGLCSDYLAGLQVDDVFEFFVQKNKRFKLPESSRDILMIGPGTGIAAFRSFLSERDAVSASGRNWLFFGEDHFVSDFFYQTEIQNWFETGVLNKVSLAFSKDKEKLTVQHKLLEQGKEVFAWISSGAHIYLCGQKAPMGVEVENALLSIIERYSGLSANDTLAYFEKLKEEGRYSKDVY